MAPSPASPQPPDRRQRARWGAGLEPGNASRAMRPGTDADRVSVPRTDAAPAIPDLIRQQWVADMRHNRQLRERFADRAHRMAVACLAAWLSLLGAQGLIQALAGIALWSDQVLIAITTGVTVSVLAAFLGVIRGLFPNRATGGA